jgi:C4-dicarboxylate transporter, DctQ subunit
MVSSMRSVASWLAHRAENVLAAMLGLMFVAFILQIAFRYLTDLPTGWAHELSVILWVWLVLWGAAFVLSEHEEIRFDVIYGAVGPRGRRVMAVITAIALIALYLVSLPAVVDYVTFMKVQTTAYLKIRFDLLFSIYILFVVAIVIRYIWLAWQALRGVTPAKFDPTKASSGV